jgi:hypothetical protein
VRNVFPFLSSGKKVLATEVPCALGIGPDLKLKGDWFPTKSLLESKSAKESSV